MIPTPGARARTRKETRPEVPRAAGSEAPRIDPPACTRRVNHRDDSLGTFLLDFFYAGRLQAMPPVYTSDDGRYRVIRPLVECAEAEIAEHARLAGYPLLPRGVRGSRPNLKRARVEALVRVLEREIPDLRSVMLAALRNCRPSHLLDREVAGAWEEASGRSRPRR